MQKTDNWNDILQGHIQELSSILEEIEGYIGKNKQANGKLDGLRAEKSRLRELLTNLEKTEQKA